MIESHPDQLKSKLILANKKEFTGGLIDNGRLGLTGHDKFYILDKLKNLEIIKQFLESKLVRLLCNNIKYRMSFADKDAFDFIINPIKILPPKHKYDINLIYKYFDFTPDEINIIENYNY
jgi:hypothetical protein